MLPLWADVLIIAALPAILLAAVWIGDDEPDNMTVHNQENAPWEDPDEMLAAA